MRFYALKLPYPTQSRKVEKTAFSHFWGKKRVFWGQNGQNCTFWTFSIYPQRGQKSSFLRIFQELNGCWRGLFLNWIICVLCYELPLFWVKFWSLSANFLSQNPCKFQKIRLSPTPRRHFPGIKKAPVIKIQVPYGYGWPEKIFRDWAPFWGTGRWRIGWIERLVRGCRAPRRSLLLAHPRVPCRWCNRHT